MNVLEQTIGKRRTRLAIEQREALLSFMEKNPILATGRFPGSNGSKIKAQLWNELSDYLNRMGALGQGTTKTPDRWMKSWQDWRCDVKAKAWRLRSHNGASTGTPQLTPIEERLLAFMGRENPDDHHLQDCLDQPNGQYSDENEYNLERVDIEALTVDISSPTPSESHNRSPVPSSSLSPVTCIAQSTSSYPAGSSHHASNTVSQQSPLPSLQDLKQSPRDSVYSPVPEPPPSQATKRRRNLVERDEHCEPAIESRDEREVLLAERLAAAMKSRAEAAVVEAAAEEREAAAAERKATAVEREAAALERKAAAVERLVSAAERRAAALERASAFTDRNLEY